MTYLIWETVGQAREPGGGHYQRFTVGFSKQETSQDANASRCW